MNNKEKGTLLEMFVAERLQEIFNETPSIRPTKASSGGKRNTEIGDINSKNVFVECKNHNKTTISLKVWDKLINSIPMNSTKTPLYIVKRPTGEILITLKFEDFFRILKEKE